jgi:predicted DsbA family dithiol-disulfide isomerase
MDIEVYHDLTCPWCRIGHKNLKDAMQEWTEQSGEPFEIKYRSYMLYPEIPPRGVLFMDMMVRKMGNMSRAYQALEQISRAGAPVGLKFRFDRIEWLPNTMAPHMLLKWTDPGKKTQMAEKLYQAFFEEGHNIGDMDVLTGIAESVGYDPNEARKALLDENIRHEVEKDLEQAGNSGIQSIPFFIIQGRLAMAGAHPKDNFLRAFQEVKAS